MKHNCPLLAGLLIVAPLTLTGCGGGGSNGSGASRSTGGTTAALTGDVAAQAAIVSSYQAFQGGVNYPFAQVQATLPSGSAFKASLRAALLKRATAHGLTAHTGASADGIGLYSATSTSGAGATLNFYTDAAETQSVGALTITQTAPATTSLTLGTYTSYPVDFAITANLTSGPLPCTGSGTIALTDSAGAGEIKGNITLPATNVTANADLTLDDSGTIGGTVTVNEKAQTLTLTGLSGGLAGAITGNVTVAPGGDTGTAALNIAAGTFQVTLHTPTGTATGASNASGGLDITLPSGASETISSPLTASPDAPITTTGGGTTTTGGGTTGTGGGGGTGTGGGGTGGSLQLNVPVQVTSTGGESQVDVGGRAIFVNNGGQVLKPDALSPLVFYQSAMGASMPVNTAAIENNNAYDLYVTGFNNNGAFIANTSGQYSSTIGYFWSGPTASPMALAVPTGSTAATGEGLSNTGQIVGFVGSTAATWASASAPPTLLQPLGSDTYAAATGVNDSGLIVGVSGGSTPVYWTSGSQMAQALPTPNALNGIMFSNVHGPLVNNAGQIVYSGYFWASKTAQPVALPGLPGLQFAVPLCINSAGTIGGYCSPGGGGKAVLWKQVNGQFQVTDLNSLIPSGFGATLVDVTSINDSGLVAGIISGPNRPSFVMRTQ